jgi:hypothetical protein
MKSNETEQKNCVDFISSTLHNPNELIVCLKSAINNKPAVKLALASLLVSIVIILCLKIIFKLICLRLNIGVKFKFGKLYEITNIYLNASLISLEISIDKLWLTSCFVNRNVNDRLMLCAQSINVNYLHTSDAKPSLHHNGRNKYFKFLNLMLNLIGASIYLENINFNILNELNVVSSRLHIESVRLSQKKKTIYHFEVLKARINYEKEACINTGSWLSISKTNLDVGSKNSIYLHLQEPVICIKNLNSFHKNENIEFSRSDVKRSKAVGLINNARLKKCKIERFKFVMINQKGKQESVGGDLLYSQIDEDKHELLLTKIDYFKVKNGDNARYETIFNHTILDKLLVKYVHEKLVVIDFKHCNFYIDISYLQSLKTFLSKFYKQYNISSSSAFVKQQRNYKIEFKINLNNFYLNLIHYNGNIYTLGATQIDFNVNNQLEYFSLNMSKFLVFKSTKNSDLSKLEYTNNLFRREVIMNSQTGIILRHTTSKGLIQKLNLMNQIKEKLNDDSNGFIHYWGCLFYVNAVSLTFFNRILNARIDNIFVEHSSNYMAEIMQVVDQIKELGSFFCNYDACQQSNLPPTVQIDQIKLKIKSVNFYFLLRKAFWYFSI